MIKYLLTTAALLISISAAEAKQVACQPTAQAAKAGKNIYVQYRLIDGRKCWYPGHKKLAKSMLAWKNNPVLDKPRKRSAAAEPLPHDRVTTQVKGRPNRGFNSPDRGHFLLAGLDQVLAILCGGDCPDFSKPLPPPPAPPILYLQPTDDFAHAFSQTFQPLDWTFYIKP
jgi:hypothetical protein